MSDTDGFEKEANSLTEALEMAEALFAQTFRAPANFPLVSGSNLLFKKKGDQGYCLLVEPAPSSPTVHFKAVSLKTRIEVARALPGLWKACEEVQQDLRAKAHLASEDVLAFIKEHQS